MMRRQYPLAVGNLFGVLVLGEIFHVGGVKHRVPQQG